MVDHTAFGLGEFHFSWGDHILAVFESPDQQMEVMGAFVAHGLQAVQRCVWAAPEASSERLRSRLADMGGDLPTLEVSSQLVIISDVDFYLQEGIFEPDRTMDLLRRLLEDGQREGYATMRMATDVSWLSEGRVDPQLWEQFESTLTREVAGLPAVMVCQYGRRQLSGSTVVTAFRTHPIVILGDVVHENPFFVGAAEGTIKSQDVL